MTEALHLLTEQLRLTLRDVLPLAAFDHRKEEESLEERKDFLDPGLTNHALYFDTSAWFPKSKCILPSETLRSTRLLAEIDRDGLSGANISFSNPAEQIRLNKLMMQKDTTIALEKKTQMERKKSVTQRKREVREERQKNIGRKWFELGRPVMTDELRQELAVLRLQQYSKPGKFKKTGRGAIGGNEEYFEVGTIVAPASAHYTDRTSSSAEGRVKKSAKLGFVDSLLKDQEYRKYAKRKRMERLEKQEKNARFASAKFSTSSSSRPSKKAKRE